MKKKVRFGLIGAAGFVAPRHMAAIKAVGGDLVAACDPHDSVGILDRYFPNCWYTTNLREFFVESNNRLDYISICTPNHLHATHCNMAIEVGAEAICEKPLTTTEASLERLNRGKVWPILQLRCHPAVIEWQKSRPKNRVRKPRYKVEVEYYTPRGHWYHASWKGDPDKSGGILANIGIHLFDLCHYLFGRRIDSHCRVNDISANA
jgi:UDP-N-acetyl-2-amino-2-deoxyglucuronate dehydrogenase